MLINNTFNQNQAVIGGALVTEIINSNSTQLTIDITGSFFLQNNADLYGASILEVRDNSVQLDSANEIIEKNNTGLPAKIRLTAYTGITEEEYNQGKNVLNFIRKNNLTPIYDSFTEQSRLVMQNVSSGGSLSELLVISVYDFQDNLIAKLGSDEGK